MIVDRIFSNKSGAFFIDGPGGTGKTFLYRSLLVTIRSKGFVALATSTSGVAAFILPGGRTAHSCFKIPIDIDENIDCNNSKQSSLACLIRDAKLIIWDEASMAEGKTIEAFDLLLKDLMDTKMLFGGKVVIFGEKLQLSENMRARTDHSFCEYLMRIGNGKERLDAQQKVQIPNSLIIHFTTQEESLNKLFKVTYPNKDSLFDDSSSIASRVILTTKNDFVHEINDMLISTFPKDARTYAAIDETVEPNNQSQFEDYLHTLNHADFVGIYLREPVFSHGQLYVVLSRAKSSEGVKLLIRPQTSDTKDDHSMYNIVYDEVIQKAFN
ncbi:uncharacterized protein LOC142162349 [Nicotiana tabacum]|uniref:Uncharacterized protein LOC142162349 n=1 Tax=Nicotiana tabacum TaxID=4097 RepID=A0AC58RPW9_TOBAC